MKRKVTSIMLLSALLAAGTSTFTSCKDTTEDVSNDLRGQVNDLQSLVKQQATALEQITDKFNGLENIVKDGTVGQLIESKTKEAKDLAQSAKDLAQTALNKANEVDGKLADYATIEQLNTAIANIKQCECDMAATAALVSRVQALEDAVNGSTTGSKGLYQQVIEIINNQDNVFGPQLEQVIKDAADAMALAKADSIRLDELKAKVDGNSTDIDLIKEEITKLNNKDITAELNKYLKISDYNIDKAQFTTDIATAQNTADQALAKANGLKDEITPLIATAKQEAIDAAYQKAQDYADGKFATKDELQAVKDAYKDADTKLSEKIDAIELKLKTLIGNLSDALNKLVTGVIIQAAENPVFGSVNLPVDVNTNVLAAYYGTASKTVRFPAADNTNYVDPSEFVDFGVRGDKLASENETICSGSAGKLYVTINPNTVDFDGMSFDLVDSKDVSAKTVGFENLQFTKCNDKTLTFGWTRAAENNGFYVADVKIAKEKAAQARPDVDARELASAAKQVINKMKNPTTTNLDLTDVATTMYKQLNNKLKAYAVKVSYNGVKVDAKGNAVTTENSVYSDYKLAVTSLPAITFGQMYTLDSKANYRIPMIPTLESKGLVFDHFNYNPVTLEKQSVTVAIPDVSKVIISEKETGETIVRLEDNKFEFVGSNLNITPNGETTIDVSLEEFQKVIDNLNDQMDGMMSDVNGIIDRFNKLTNTVDNTYISTLNKMINKFNKIITNPYSFVQPCLAYEGSDKGFHQLSRAEFAPTVLHLNGKTEAAVILKPISYSADLIVPIYKKYVAVTKVDGNASAAAKNYANGGSNMNKVLDGSTRDAVLQVNAKGLYEIAYSEVDYGGNIITKKYYVKVVD